MLSTDKSWLHKFQHKFITNLKIGGDRFLRNRQKIVKNLPPKNVVEVISYGLMSSLNQSK